MHQKWKHWTHVTRETLIKVQKKFEVLCLTSTGLASGGAVFVVFVMQQSNKKSKPRTKSSEMLAIILEYHSRIRTVDLLQQPNIDVVPWHTHFKPPSNLPVYRPMLTAQVKQLHHRKGWYKVVWHNMKCNLRCIWLRRTDSIHSPDPWMLAILHTIQDRDHT